jgi:transposase
MDVKELHAEGLTIKQIVRKTGLSRNTVRRVLRGEHPMKMRLGQRASKLEPFKGYLRERFEQYALSAVRLHPEIAAMGYEGSIQTVRRFLAELRGPSQRQAKVTLRFETPPGKQAQADWAECGRFDLGADRPVKVYAFVMVLGYSRMRFVRFTTGMRLAELIACHQAAFDYFGGWPREILYDNMKQVRLDRGRLNEAFCDFAEHHGFTVKTHRPYRPRTKGKVERTVDYLKDNFLAGRSFAGLEDLNAQASHWLDNVANANVHGTTGKVPRELLALEGLTPIGACPAYRLAQPVRRTVSREAMVHFAGSRYSVPPDFAGQAVHVQAAGGMLTVRAADVVIAEHRQALKAGQAIVAREHLAELWRLTAEQTAVPAAPAGERWHLLAAAEVERMPLTRFEEVIA